MKNYLDVLTEPERKVIIMAPVFAAIRGALEDGRIKPREEKDAISLAHLRTVTSEPILHSYYKEVEKSFQENIKMFENYLPETVEESKEMIRKELRKVTPILKKMDCEFAEELSKSLQSFSKHVANTKSVLEEWLHYFIIPKSLERE